MQNRDTSASAYTLFYLYMRQEELLTQDNINNLGTKWLRKCTWNYSLILGKVRTYISEQLFFPVLSMQTHGLCLGPVVVSQAVAAARAWVQLYLFLLFSRWLSSEREGRRRTKREEFHSDVIL